MGDSGFQFLDILLLGAIAVFIALRLRAVLGQRTGHEQQRRGPLAGGNESPAESGDNVIALPRRDNGAEDAEATPPDPKEARIRAADPSFSGDEFLKGAAWAYEEIVGAFAAGDKPTLKGMLSREVFADFEKVIDDRARQGQTQETTFVGLKNVDIVDTALNGRTAEVTVRFQSELISATRDRNGNVIAGDPQAVDQVTDIWTFARDTRSRDPNWTLIATASPG